MFKKCWLYIYPTCPLPSLNWAKNDVLPVLKWVLRFRNYAETAQHLRNSLYILYHFANDYNSTPPCFVRTSPENCPKSSLFLILAILIGEKWHFLVVFHRWAGKNHSEVYLHKISRMFEHLKFRISAKSGHFWPFGVIWVYYLIWIKNAIRLSTWNFEFRPKTDIFGLLGLSEHIIWSE